MECPLKSGPKDVEAAEVLVAYVARQLPPSEEAALERHLGTCSPCQKVAAAQRQVWAALDEWTPAPVDSNFDARLYARIAGDRETPWWKRGLALNWSWKPAMPVAAACAALLAAFLIKSPITEQTPQAGLQPRIDIEQVERAFDDIDMLKQIGVAAISTPIKPVHSQSL